MAGDVVLEPIWYYDIALALVEKYFVILVVTVTLYNPVEQKH